MRAGTIVLGRRTYEEWAAFWPSKQGDGGMGDHINRTRKLVASRTLDTLDRENSSLIAGDVPDALTRLKGEPGDEIWITGSGTLVRSLLESGVIDELRLLVHPVVVGRGKRLFEGGAGPKRMTLAESETLGSGVLRLTYAAEAGDR